MSQKLIDELRFYEGESEHPGNNIFSDAALRIEQLGTRVQVLESAARKLVFLDDCEQEGMSNGQPEPEEWIEALDNLRNALYQEIC